MLLLTENATVLIGSLIDRPELPDSAGLRISTTPDRTQPLSVSTVTEPDASDAVIVEQGARVYLAPEAAAMLDDQVLDAQVTDQGSVQFLLSVQ